MLGIFGHEPIKGLLNDASCGRSWFRGGGEGGEELSLGPKSRDEVKDDVGGKVGGGWGEIEREDVEGVFDVDVDSLANAANCLFGDLALT